MTAAKIESLGGGRFRVSGELTFATARAALEEMRAAFAGAGDIEIDLAGVDVADSAGLALLIEWYRWAAQANKSIRFAAAPPQLRALAQISELDRLLSLNDSAASNAAA